MHVWLSGRYVSPYHLALVTSALNRREEALDLLEKAFETGDAKVCGWESIPSSIHCTGIRVSTICCASGPPSRCVACDCGSVA